MTKAKKLPAPFRCAKNSKQKLKASIGFQGLAINPKKKKRPFKKL
jgi:hypothetical protein